MKYILSAVFLWMATIAFAQPWVEMMDDPNVNFYEVQKAFDEAWGDHGYERGKGYKQFKRWEFFTEQRVYPSGNRDLAEKFWMGAQQAQAIPGKEAKSQSLWQPVGPVQWESIGWNPGLGRINAITVDPNDASKIYASTPSGGLWVYADETWTSLTDHLPSIGATGLAIDPDDSDVMYLATGDGDGSDTYSIGVLKSINGGQTWLETGLTLGVAAGQRIGRIIMNPDDSENIYAAGSPGLFATTNAGDTWTQLLSGTHRDVRLKPGNSQVIYAAGTNKFRYSTDGGETFQNASGLPNSSEVNRYAIAVTPANPELVYLLAGKSSDSGFLGLYRSQDSGQTFELMSDSPNIFTYSEIGEGEGGQSWYDMAIAASPTDENHIVVGGINVWASLDGGATWQIKSHWVYPSALGYTHADIHSLDFYGDKLYCGSDGGIFRSDNDGDAWTDLSDGLQISQYYRIAASTTDPHKLLVGSQDNGTNLFGAGDTYTHLLGGDGNAAAIDYSNDNIMYAAYPGGNFQRSSDGGSNFYNFTSSISETGAWVTPFDLHPTQPEIAFAAYENVWKYDQGIWAKMGELPTSSTLNAMEISPADPSVIYTSTFSSLYRTSEGTDEWTPIYGGLPNLYITDIETDPENADRVWVTFSGYNADHKVYHSENGGQTWTNITENLPNLPVNCISYLQGSDDGLYIGTDNGVFYRSNESPNWSSFNDGLPNVIVKQILFHYGSQKVIVATYGRGVWKNDFFDGDNLSPTANFSASPRLICSGDSVSFSNFSVNASSGAQWLFEGGSPATSTEFSPTVTYNTPGIFDVRLIAFNNELADTLLFSDYLQVLSSTGEAAPFFEDFEEPLATRPWIVSMAGDPVGWEQTDIGYLSDHSIWVDNFSNPAGKSEIIDSHPLDLSALDTAFVTMRVAYAPKPNMSIETLKVYVSTDCGETWSYKRIFMSFSELASAASTAEPFVPVSEDEWNFLVVDNIEPEERTDDFRLRLEFTTGGGNNIYIDDINIVDEIIVGIPSRENPNYLAEVVPNPAKGSAELRFTLPTTTSLGMRIVNASGQAVYMDENRRYPSGENRMELNLEHLKPGVYFIELTSVLGRGVQKLVVIGQ